MVLNVEKINCEEQFYEKASELQSVSEILENVKPVTGTNEINKPGSPASNCLFFYDIKYIKRANK